MQVYRLFFSIAFVLGSIGSNAQIVRSVVGSSHTITSNASVRLQAAVAQPYFTQLLESQQNELRPGFIQPVEASKTKRELVTVEAFPNPTSGKVNLSIDRDIQLEIAVFNTMGTKVPIIITESSSWKLLDFTHLPAGVYTVNFKDGFNTYNPLQIIHVK